MVEGGDSLGVGPLKRHVRHMTHEQGNGVPSVMNSGRIKIFSGECQKASSRK